MTNVQRLWIYALIIAVIALSVTTYRAYTRIASLENEQGGQSIALQHQYEWMKAQGIELQRQNCERLHDEQELFADFKASQEDIASCTANFGIEL